MPEACRLLLVDDESGYVRVLGNRLEKRGFSVLRATSGADAIRLLRHDTADVAILDLKMEDMDGLDVLKIFQRMAPETAVIMLTGHGSEEARKEALKAGASDYLTKPCELETMLEAINRILDIRG
ncbi:response regulator receiver domain-containing protein [Desulfobotulus alkaliphilus]|uniref:Response regulator receiver domain-containing protein n=1 Tax=Desulfobotulus alkaliphilus TaxID=622671 RepID=A0A562RYJ0_9BACT|nr:response regulator [Desulfobotulus alkaliphilus]TWI74171.1 response regulator receiver domain-containing protein [Desulfobotulus alkaliphilus]